MKALLFKASYQDETIPPPYYHTYTIEAMSVPDGLEVNYDLQYLERDTIDEQEILTEGFTLDDDFKWKGKLNLVWKTFFSDLIERTSFKKAPKTSVFKMEVHDKLSVPENAEEWLYVLQEVTQAIFEEADRESPLEVSFVEVEKNKKYENTMIVSFADRSVYSIESSDGNVKKQNKNWKDTRKIMETIYSADYLGEKALSTTPAKPGKYINIGDGVWYEFGVSVLNPGKKDFLSEIAKIFSPSR